ncbi:uncharacterized protein LOC126567115 [Anopheles maculipalpis]|uniref:uncharacterized protein LOC126567115 n=1 Tax=Anopheles maculipalpis TaxID=1496333 RepID=UPI00215959C3|nr:uncharacterized protein LOC126567115 [Anopheles maculipalpis]
MASTENETQPESVLQVEESADVEQEAGGAEESAVSKVSVLSSSFEPNLSTIVEENDTPVLSRESNATPPMPRFQQSRYEQLALPKVQHLEETLDRFEKSKKYEMSERIMKIRMRLRELRGTEKQYSRQLQTESTTKNFSGNSEIIYNNLQRSLRKVAFETLAKQIFDKLPDLIVKMYPNRTQQTTPGMQALLDTLQTTLYYYLGQPMNEYEDRVFNYLCNGLAKFIENIIENVHTSQQESERVAMEGKTGNGPYPVAVQLARKAYNDRQ